jgi:transcriptional regulator with PAS, ATPase and Fis domain
MNLTDIKNRFGVIGTAPALDRAIDTAWRVASTDLTVLITGESGTGKEVFSKLIHSFSSRKHGSFIAVNCGAIPEGTIDSELFGHEKGSFTGANEARKGYFEVANGGTIFLDEVAELPLQTQVRLLRVLESGEFIKVGASKVIKTDVRIVAATNVNIPDAIAKGKFREDLYYRLNTVPIVIPPLRERGGDVALLFRKFASDFAEKYRMPAIRLDELATQQLINYRWPGNVRQLKNVTEQISIIENDRMIGAETLMRYLPGQPGSNLPLVSRQDPTAEFSEREILYKVLFDMKRDMVEMKKILADIIQGKPVSPISTEDAPVFHTDGPATAPVIAGYS